MLEHDSSCQLSIYNCGTDNIHVLIVHYGLRVEIKESKKRKKFGYFRLPRGLSRRTRHCRSRAGARHGMCELTARHGRGTAWARQAMCESAFKASWLVYVQLGLTLQTQLFLHTLCILLATDRLFKISYVLLVKWNHNDSTGEGRLRSCVLLTTYT